MINVIKTGLLLFILTGLVLAGGYAIGGPGAVKYALIIAAVMNFFGYFFSDKLALMAMRAQQVGPKHELYRIVAALVQRANMPMPRVYVSPTAAPNAFATGRNPRNAAVCATTGLMQILDREDASGTSSARAAERLGYAPTRSWRDYLTDDGTLRPEARERLEAGVTGVQRGRAVG